MTNATLTNLTSVTGVGGLFNFNHREFQGTLFNLNITGFNSKSAGTLLYLKASSLTLNATQNVIRCRDVPLTRLRASYLSDLLDGPSTAVQNQAFHMNLTNPNSLSNVISMFNNISGCFYDGAVSQDALGNGGGVYYLSNSLTMRDSNSTYEYNSAPFGSIYVCDGCNIASQGNVYQNNVCQRGCIIFYKADSIRLTSSNNNNINIKSSKFVDNLAKMSASGAFLQGSP